MGINYQGPAVSLVHPSGSEGSPTVYPISSITLNPVIQWSYTDQTELSEIQVQIFDGSTLIWDSYGVKMPQDEKSAMFGDSILHLLSLRHFEIPGHNVIPFNKTYSIRIRAMDTHEDPRWRKWGEWSEPAFFKVQLSPMSSFVRFNVDVYANDREEKIILSWSDNTQEIGDLSGFNILRSDHPDGSFIKVNGSLIQDRIFEDYAAAHVRYYYKIEAVMDDGTTALSPVTNGSIVVQYWTIGSFKFAGPSSLNKKRERAQSKRPTLRQRRVIQDRGFLPEDIQLEIYLTDDQESSGAEKYDDLMVELEKLSPLIVRDPFGRSWTVTPGSFEDQQLKTGKLEYRVKIDLSEVSG